MTELEKINRLTSSIEFKKIQELGLKKFEENRKFDFMSVFINSIDEMAVSKLFAYLFDSRKNHNLGQKPFRKFLELIPELIEFSEKLPSENETETACTTEIMTYNSRRIDILIQLIDMDGKVKAVLGIENKINSGELKNQVSDYQKHLSEKYEIRIPKLLIFLTPDGRVSKTLDNNSKCPAISVSYSIISEICSSFNSIEQSQIFLNILKNHIDKLTSNKELNFKTLKLINDLYLDENNRHAIKLISQNVPNSRKVFDNINIILSETKNLFPKTKLKKYYIEYEPKTTRNPNEFKLYPSELKESTYILTNARENCACYMLFCENKSPDIGDSFTLKIMLWIEELKKSDQSTKNEIKRKVNKFFTFPNPLEINEDWGQWVCLWTGNEYTLQDMGENDVEGLKKLLVDGIEQTYDEYKKGIRNLQKNFKK